MHTKPLIALAFIVPGLLLGCDRSQGGNAPPSPPAGVTPTVSSPPVAAPATTPSVTPPAADATSGSALTRDERNTKMPLPGQANDHSTPAPAKRGDDKTPAKAP